jgi:hypothetical protein
LVWRSRAPLRSLELLSAHRASLRSPSSSPLTEPLRPQTDKVYFCTLYIRTLYCDWHRGALPSPVSTCPCVLVLCFCVFVLYPRRFRVNLRLFLCLTFVVSVPNLRR